MKKYIIITGSPRKEGNSDKIAAQCEAQLKAAGFATEVFRIEDKKVGSCQACEYCKTHDGCVQKDDASAVIEELKNCAGAVFVAPIYFGSVPGTCKVLTDRFYSMFNPAKGSSTPATTPTPTSCSPAAEVQKKRCVLPASLSTLASPWQALAITKPWYSLGKIQKTPLQVMRIIRNKLKN